MHRYLSLALAAAVASLLFITISSVVRNRRNAAKARQLGCKPIAKLPQSVWDPLNFSLVSKFDRTTKNFSFIHNLYEQQEYMRQLKGYPLQTYNMSALAKPLYMTSDPKNVQALLATQFRDFGLGPLRSANFHPLLGTGIFTQDGEGWEHSRHMLRPAFAKERVSELELEDGHCRNMMAALPTNRDGWTNSVDMQVIFFRLTLDSATEFLFGESVLSQLHEMPESQRQNASPLLRSPEDARNEKAFASGFDKAQLWLARRSRLGYQYWLLDGAEFRKSCKQCHDFIDSYVRLALNKELREKELEKGTVRGKEKYIFLEELAQQTRDPIELRSQLLHTLLAGRDTTASLLGWLFFLLVRHSDVFHKLRSVIVEDFGTYQNQEEMTFAKLKGCQYLQHCLNEALRLFPVVPVNSRTAVKDTTIPRGGGPDGQSPVFIPKGQEVGYSVYVMHRNKELWGPDAHEFKPERWLGRKVGWEFLPFNGGPRICLGQQFALTSASFATIRLLQRFDRIENLETDSSVLKQNATLTSCSALGVKVRLHEAS